MALIDEMKGLVDLAEVRAAEEEWREADAAVLPHFDKVAEADRAVRTAEQAVRQLHAPSGFRVISKEEMDHAREALEEAREAKRAAEADLLAAQDKSRAANDAIAAAKRRAYAPMLDAAIDRRIELAARVDALKVELAKIEAESKEAGKAVSFAAQNGARLPNGFAAPPLMTLAAEHLERATWQRGPSTAEKPRLVWGN